MRSRRKVLASCVLAAAVAIGATLAAVSANFDGTGIWTLADCSEDCFFLDLVQTPRGDLELREGFCAAVDCHVEIVLRRTGRRPKVGETGEYHVTIQGLPGDERECISQEGTALLDASDEPHMLAVTVSGVNWQGPDAGCQPETNSLVLQR